jgi:hypothetical protein
MLRRDELISFNVKAVLLEIEETGKSRDKMLDKPADWP